MVLTTRDTSTLTPARSSSCGGPWTCCVPATVAVADDDEAVLLVLEDGHHERLKGRSRATVGATGCNPAAAVELQNPVKPSVGQLAGLRKLAPGDRRCVSRIVNHDGNSGIPAKDGGAS